ncbi:glycosyltransferase family 2 protein [Lachnospira eligens]|jgi:glycosyltransferase involved in cell wall biosynthesis|uniref:glycosyltransferase family 2 protein n=1 Tax=Lachnospira eligens TaxID=39485 RepID=UPI00095DBF56|nr:glycosyltransferase family 2 protein [Lachnospira eligens]OLA16937.1 MAG: hypothetical protein BHW24_02615 [Lachnospira eligens]
MISIIMPIYNGEKFLEKSIQNLLSQPYKDIELILVNDGSKDDSLSICKKYENRDNRVVLIDKPNGGISSSRNLGIEKAKGQWISFIDQDDLIEKDIYINLVKNITVDTDMVISGKRLLLLDEKDKVIKEENFEYENETIKSREEIINLICNINGKGSLMHLWNCLYKKEIIKNNNLSFDENFKYGHEDSLFNVKYATKCKNIKVNSGIVYNYYRRYSVSTSLKSNTGYLKDFAEYCKKSSEYIITDSLEEQNMIFTYYIRLGLNLLCQYQCNEKFFLNDLICIYKCSSDNSKSKKIILKGIGLKKYLYLKLIVFTISKKQERLSKLLINLHKS